MTSTTRSFDDAPYLDILSLAPDELPTAIDRLRLETGLVRTPIGGMVIRRDMVMALLADRRVHSAVLDLFHEQGLGDSPILELMSSALLTVDGDVHQRLRRLVSRAFTPRAADPYRSVMRSVLDSLLEPVLARGSCEFMAEVADPFPILVMCHLLGVPEEDHGDFTAWNRAFTWIFSFELAEHREEAEWGTASLDRYAVGLIEDRRRQPRDDLVTALVQAEEAGDRLSDVELRAMIIALLFAGSDATRCQLGTALALFAQHPDQWALLAARADLIPQAVEEVMRFSGPVGNLLRYAVEDIAVDGYTIPAGTPLALSTTAANHDPSFYADPATFDITAPREPQLSFGGGPHFCLGAGIARAEMQEALARLAGAMPDLALAGDVVWRNPFRIYGPDHLPLRFGRGGA